MTTDYQLGLKIANLLREHNLENSVCTEKINLWSDVNQMQVLESKLADFISSLGIDLSGQSLKDTPKRMVNLFIEDLFWGLSYHNFPALGFEDNTFAYHSPIISKNINISSTCEHHFVAINGSAVIAYIPNKKIIGLGKINQIVNFFSHRPQIQERLTCQIFRVLQYILDTQDVAVAIKASHDCITRRRNKVLDNEVLSIELGGKFQEDIGLKSSFLNIANELK